MIAPMDRNNEFAELEQILAHAQKELQNLVKREGTLVETLAVEAERKRITEDMVRIIMPRFDTLHALANESDDESLVAEFEIRLNTIAESARGIMAEIHPPLLAKAGLVSSIRTLVELFRRSSRIETALISDLLSDQMALSLEAKFAIYRVTQEALNNIEKHSGATRARLIIKQTAAELIVSIEDNGSGFQERRSTQSRGLKNIRERAASIGASVAWERSTSFDTGTLLSISLRCAQGSANKIDGLCENIQFSSTDHSKPLKAKLR